jgi:hypothetical protein
MSKPSKEQTNTVEKKSPTSIFDDTEIKEQFSGVLSNLSAFRHQITMLQNQVRGL